MRRALIPPFGKGGLGGIFPAAVVAAGTQPLDHPMSNVLHDRVELVQYLPVGVAQHSQADRSQCLISMKVRRVRLGVPVLAAVDLDHQTGTRRKESTMKSRRGF